MSLTTNYDIVLDSKELEAFIQFLPLLNPGECYYCALFARKKYHESAKNDKSQCKRFVATDKNWLFRKIMQLEIADGAYTNKDGSQVHNDSLSLYINLNPRSFALAQRRLLVRLAESIAERHIDLNPSAAAFSEIQKAKSRTAWVDFDFDNMSSEDLYLGETLNEEAYRIINTRGGFHLLVHPPSIQTQFMNNWYVNIAAHPNCDVTGDNMVPIPGCTQGGFIPRLIL